MLTRPHLRADVGNTGGGGSVDFKNSRRVASRAALPAYTRTGNDIVADADGALPTIDGVALSVGNSFLLRNGAAGADNGLWDVVDLGDGTSPFQLARSADADTSAEVTSGMRVPISEGSFAGQVFYLATPDPITLNTTALTFVLDTGLPAGMFGAIPVATGAYVADKTVPGVATTPGWNVGAEFDLDVLPTVGAVLDGIVLVSQAALTGRLKLYDVTGGADVAGSTLSTVSLTGEHLTSGDLTAALVAGRRYQIQAECTGGAAQSDFAAVRYATLVPL